MDHNEFQTVLSAREEHHETKGVSFFRPSVVVAVTLAIFAAIGGIMLYRLTLPPAAFPPNTLIRIPEGYSIAAIGGLLESSSVVRSRALFAFAVSQTDKEHSIAAGDYLFVEPVSLWEVVRRFAEGEHGIAIHRVLIPEGATVADIAETLSEDIPDLDHERFMREALPYEGYLFPDTYFFYSTATSGPIIATMRKNFEAKTADLYATANSKGEEWARVVNLASIVEKEAATARDRRLIAGILLHRMEIGMRLQVDAPFMYTIGKGSLELSGSDLESDSPYNTYRHEGLPPTPIGNPGADAILAVLEPEHTEYLYYLSDKEGRMYYAKTFNEHKLNKAKYLP
jgi:UPF0755 protein